MKKQEAYSQLPKKTWFVLSYCEIPEDVADTNRQLTEGGCDCYISYTVVSKAEQDKFDDDFTLTNWIIDNYPSLEGEEILIHLDY